MVQPVGKVPYGIQKKSGGVLIFTCMRTTTPFGDAALALGSIYSNTLAAQGAVLLSIGKRRMTRLKNPVAVVTPLRHTCGLAGVTRILCAFHFFHTW